MPPQVDALYPGIVFCGSSTGAGAAGAGAGRGSGEQGRRTRSVIAASLSCAIVRD